MDIPLSIEEQSLFDFAAVRLETESYPSPPADILQRKFMPVKTAYSKDELHFPDSIKSCWIKFVLRNRQSHDTTIALVFPGAVSKAALYRSEKGSFVRIGKTGFFLAVTARNVEYQDNRIDLTLKAGSVSVYLIQVILYHGVWMGKMPVLQNYTYAETIAFRFEKQINRRNLMWLHFFTGIFFMFFVFGLIKFLVFEKDKAYLYYALMGLFNALLTISMTEYPPLEFTFFENIRGIEWFDLLVEIAVTVQGLFILQILQLRSKYPRVTLVILWFFLLKFLLVVCRTVLFYTRTHVDLFDWLDIAGAFLIMLLMLIWVVYMATIRKGFYRFIFGGAITVFTSFTFVFIVRFFQLQHLLPAWFGNDQRGNPQHLLQIGLVIDMIFYFTGLAYRDRQVEKDKILYQEQLKLQKLESEKTKVELQQQATELEMQALRAQMNPHFIFNSLNSINRFILENNRLQASQYLTKFSKLIRMILQNSQASLITLESELEALRLYLDLESLRFDYHFDYTISISQELDLAAIKVPPLIVQPYVENAIWHGLMLKKEEGHLEISLFEKDDTLCCRITDNGIGRIKSAELKAKSGSSHKSMGMKITSDRISMLQNKNQFINHIQITDLVLADGTPGGTEVLLTLPLYYD
jgi:sensor histidine kinase YesM